MIRKLNIIFLSLLVFTTSMHADRIDDAVRASNFEDVNYLLIMKGNAVSQHRKDELILLANEMTLVRKRGTLPCGTLWDAYMTAKGVLASSVAIACAKRIWTVRGQQIPGQLTSFGSYLQYGFFGAIGGTAGIVGLYHLIQGLRSVHGRDLYDQAQQIEKRIHELKIVE